MRRSTFIIGLVSAVAMSGSAIAAEPKGKAPAAKPAAPKAPAKPVPAAPLPKFEFRGHHVGDPLPADCKPSTTSKITSCEDKEIAETKAATKAYSLKLGEVDVLWVTYKYYDGKFYALSIVGKNRESGELRNMLIGKYGPATTESIDEVSNRLGAKFTNITSKWKFAEGTLELDDRFPDLESMGLHFTDEATDRLIKAEEAAKERAKGASVL